MSATPATHRAILTRPTLDPPSAFRVESFPDSRADERGVRLAPGGLHDLADEEADRLGFAGAEVRNGPRVRGEDRVHGCIDGSAIRDLPEPSGRHDIGCGRAGPDVLFEYLANLRPRDKAVGDE